MTAHFTRREAMKGMAATVGGTTPEEQVPQRVVIKQPAELYGF